MHESVFASAKRWQGPDRSTSYHYLYPLRRTGHLRIRHSEGPRTPLLISLLFCFRPTSCSYFVLFIPRSTSTFDRGDYPGFCYLPYSYCAFEKRASQLLACTFPDLTAPHSFPHAQNCLLHTTIALKYVLLRNPSTCATCMIDVVEISTEHSYLWRNVCKSRVQVK